ncbi:glycerol-3-phosphate 1-O-acyltransferase PlsY [Algicella marina]|uniref:Glycerol-3-phosphate acyltransferase n=1 Tax=Algicella marina TaxID=2683284 RepID=A0A6P1T6Q2_9RHOB|nr:glycerol-3-phosphate 1-O-acyltransferase PlsY [Algicella marina]QHQ37166.1 glycerol-3-phosphate 1-O-acyltransferase PlsY [Algicella marina]
MSLILAAILGYLFGSVPFGLVITRALGLGDLRKIGSGNIGATNVLRTGHKPAALATLILDVGKGAIALLLARALLGEPAALAAGLAAILGHLFPVWLGFIGGKGVATCLGLLLALNFWAGLIACAVWAAVAAAFRISSLAGMSATASSLVSLPLLGRTDALIIAVPITALVIWKHRTNIARLRNGTEPRIGQGAKTGSKSL